MDMRYVRQYYHGFCEFTEYKLLCNIKRALKRIIKIIRY